MKKFLTITAICLTAVSCQKKVIEDVQNGLLTVKVKNSPVVLVQTKADEQAESATVSTDDFTVTVSSAANTYNYIYGQMPSTIAVPSGVYSLHAENVTLEQSHTLPDQWGQKRYAGDVPTVVVTAGGTTASATISCKMVNSALSVIFDQSVADTFSEYALKTSIDASRVLSFNASNAWNESEKTGAIAYFPGSSTLTYEFSGKNKSDGSDFNSSGTCTLSPATHLRLTVKVKQTEPPVDPGNDNGSISKPMIVVDYTCQDLYQTITVDPVTGDSTVTE